MLLDITSPMNNVINNQLALNLVDICSGNMLQILCINLEDLITQKLPKSGFRNFDRLTSKWYILLSSQRPSKIMVSKVKQGYALSK